MDELISRSAALALAKDICVPCKDGTAYRHRCIDPQELMELPTVQPEVLACGEGELSAYPEWKKGKWIKEKCRGQAYKCSACGHWLDFRGVNAGRGSANFCPNCGSRNEVGEQDG